MKPVRPMLPRLRPTLLASSIVISVAWTLCWAIGMLWNSGWIPYVNGITAGVGGLSLLAGLALLIVFTVGPVVALARKRFSLRLLVPLLITAVAFFAGFRIDVPQRGAVVFSRHRQEFTRLVNQARADYAAYGHAEIPPRPFFEHAQVHEGWHGAVVVEFFSGGFCSPVVFVSSDQPADVRGGCSAGGEPPLAKMDDCWYVCGRCY